MSSTEVRDGTKVKPRYSPMLDVLSLLNAGIADEVTGAQGSVWTRTDTVALCLLLFMY